MDKDIDRHNEKKANKKDSEHEANAGVESYVSAQEIATLALLELSSEEVKDIGAHALMGAPNRHVAPEERLFSAVGRSTLEGIAFRLAGFRDVNADPLRFPGGEKAVSGVSISGNVKREEAVH